MEGQWNYSSLFPLEEMALRRLTVNLWTACDILSSIEKFVDVSEKLSFKNSEKWRTTIENKVTDKLSILKLPKSLAKQLLHHVTPIGLEIKGWKAFHERYLKVPNFEASTLANICWTSVGTVDYRTTAEKFIRLELLDIVNRYSLACLYCLEEYIPALWEQLPENMKKIFYSKKDLSEFVNPRLEYCWPEILKGEQSQLDCVVSRCRCRCSFYLSTFRNLARSGNKAATEYFWQKLTPQEKEASLIQIAQSLAFKRPIDIYRFSDIDDFPSGKMSDTLCYLLSLMNTDQQFEVLKMYPFQVLRCFVDWPWQDHFLKIAGLFWYSPSFDFTKLFQIFYDSVIEYGYYSPSLFQEFFRRSPVDIKKSFVDQERQSGVFFPHFFNKEDSETIEVIFKNIDSTDKVSLVSCKTVFELFDHFIRENRWHIVEVCLRWATLSKKDTERLKSSFLGFLKRTHRGHITFRSQHWKFLQLLDEANQSA